MWWNRKTVDPNEALIRVLKEEIAVLRLQHDTDQQRMDRLMEALARRANVDLVMPMPPIPQVETAPIRIPNPWKDPNLVTDNFSKQSSPKEKRQ